MDVAMRSCPFVQFANGQLRWRKMHLFCLKVRSHFHSLVRTAVIESPKNDSELGVPNTLRYQRRAKHPAQGAGRLRQNPLNTLRRTAHGLRGKPWGILNVDFPPGVSLLMFGSGLLVLPRLLQRGRPLP